MTASIISTSAPSLLNAVLSFFACTVLGFFISSPQSLDAVRKVSGSESPGAVPSLFRRQKRRKGQSPNNKGGKRKKRRNNNSNHSNHHQNQIQVKGNNSSANESDVELKGESSHLMRLGGNLTGKEWAAAALIFILAIGVYWNSLDGEFVHDDHVSIVRNPDVRGGRGSPWWNLFLNDYWGMSMANPLSHKSYRPLTVLTFRMNYALSNGLSPTAFHGTNVLIHAVVSILLFIVCAQILHMSLLSCLTASAIFGVHPVHTEAIAGITGRADALAGLLMMASFYLYIRSLQQRDSQPVNNGLSWGIIFSGLVGSSAMLAKETGITIIGINTLYDLYLHMHLLKRWRLGKTTDPALSLLKRRIVYMLLLVSLTLLLRVAVMKGSLPRFSPQDNPAAFSSTELTRLLTYTFLPAFNVWLMLYPYRLSYDWQMGSIPLVESLWDLRNLASGMFYLIFAWLIYHSFTTKGRNAGGALIFSSLLFISLPFLPASNLLFPVGFVAAERILYTPSIGVCILTAHGIQLLHKRFVRLRKFFLVALCLMLMSFSCRTWERNVVWKSRASLFEAGVKENPKNAKIHYNFANLQKDAGNSELAIKHYKIAISLWPEYSSAHNNLGAISEDLSSAEDCFQRAITSNPLHNGAHFNLGVIYMRSGKYDEAVVHLEECLRLDPSHQEALLFLGKCYNAMNKTSQVQNVFHKLIKSNLPPTTLHTNFAVFLQQMGLTVEALSHYLLALAETSGDTQALTHGAELAFQLGSQQLFQELSTKLLSIQYDSNIAYLLALSYKKKGMFTEAKSIFERIIEDPNNSFYKIHYAHLLIQTRNWSAAEATLKEVSEKDTYHANSLVLLSQLYVSQNRSEEAFDVLQCAVTFYCPYETSVCSQFYSQMGNIMHTNGAVLLAANYYDMAIQLDPTSVEAHSNMGAIYHLMSDYTQAQTHYKAALNIEPKNEVILDNMEKLQRAQSQHDFKIGKSKSKSLPITLYATREQLNYESQISLVKHQTKSTSKNKRSDSHFVCR